MGRTGAFLEIGREVSRLRPTSERVRDFGDLHTQLADDLRRAQASRCMMCGVAFCQSGASFGRAHTSGCPLHNLIPEWNDLLYRSMWAEAADRLAMTSPLPEFTSRVCPALCEAACNLGAADEPVTIHDNERAISDWEWAHGAFEPGGARRFAPAEKNAPSVAVIGSGPAGLAAAWDLARRGARVTVVERDDRPGGLLMYGIPNMKLPKDVVERRVAVMRELGIEFRLGVDAADDAVARDLLGSFDAVVVAAGARAPRGLQAEGFEAGLAAAKKAGRGVVYAVDYLTSATRAVLEGAAPAIDAAGLDVVVIGGGDTGNDCLGTAVRQGARSVRQIEFLPCPPEQAAASGAVTGSADGRGGSWPQWPVAKKTDYGQQEAIALMGGEMREWAVDTLRVVADDAGAVTGIEVVDLDWSQGRPERIESSRRVMDAQLVLIACGFVGPERSVFDALGASVATGPRVLPQLTSPDAHRVVAEGEVPVFAAGDARSGSSLVVSAIADAMACSAEVAQALGL